MSRMANGTYQCDGCGWDVGNGGIFTAAVVADLVPLEEGGATAVTLHLCREHTGTDGRQVPGCARTLVRDHLSAYPQETATP